MEENCSNCRFSKCRRSEAWCTKDKEVKPMHFICLRYRNGSQTELLTANGQVWWPQG